MPVLSTSELSKSEVMLRRAHHVLTFILHTYIHSLPPSADPTAPIYIPAPLSIPLLEVSADLVIPPILTYSDNVLYNWELTSTDTTMTHIDPLQLRTQTTFTGTPDEEHFYLTSSRIELVGVAALALLRSIEDEAFVGDLLSLQRISHYLSQLVGVIDDMTAVLNDVRHGCDPAVFYEQIRPWFCGQDSRPWVFEGTSKANLKEPTELSGPSAGQSSIIHVLDIFLGVDEFSHTHVPGGTRPTPIINAEKQSPFLERMQVYMPRHHRAFLNHLKQSPRSLRSIVMALPPPFSPTDGSPCNTFSPEEVEVRKDLKAAYNASVTALKRFRDAHIRIATLYIISQARRVQHESEVDPCPVGTTTTATEDPLDANKSNDAMQCKGTGGTDLMPFLKGVRDRTAAAVIR